MPPKVQDARGLRRKVAGTDEAHIASPTKKRGRPAKAGADHTVQDAAITPGKRGRPAKATIEDAPESTKPSRGRKSDAPVLGAPAATSTKGRGRPKKNTEPMGKLSTTRHGRSSKEVVAETAPTPRGRGRPPKARSLDLNRVAESSHVNKRSSARPKTTTAAATTARLNPRMRSKLRTRLPPAKVSKEEPVPQSARRGRPPKNAAQAPAAKKATSRKAAETPASKVAKPAAPRKMRGHTLRQIPDKFIAQVDQFLHDLMQANPGVSPAEHNQEQEHDMEGKADVDKNENMEPTSVSSGDQGQEETVEDAGTELVHVYDGAVDQYTDGAADDRAQSETALNRSREAEQQMQSELDEESTAPLNGKDEEDGIAVPAGEIMSDVDHQDGADNGPGLAPMNTHQDLVTV